MENCYKRRLFRYINRQSVNYETYSHSADSFNYPHCAVLEHFPKEKNAKPSPGVYDIRREAPDVPQAKGASAPAT
ncbi:MAG: hypothetical protein LBD18_04850 [Treponema sp.]|nr:hypothetical protein [Treponema sp.]